MWYINKLIIFQKDYHYEYSLSIFSFFFENYFTLIFVNIDVIW